MLLTELKNYIGQYLPTTPEELYTIQVVCMILFTVVSVIVANIRKVRQHANRVDFHYIVKNIGAGASFPVSLMLILYPIFPSISTLLSTIVLYLSIAGMFGVILSVYSLIR